MKEIALELKAVKELVKLQRVEMKLFKEYV